MPDNVEFIRSLYDAFARGDIETVLGGLGPSVEWTEAEGFPYGGTYAGPQAVLEGVFMKLGTEWDGWTAVPEEFVAQGDTVIALGDYGGAFKATGKSFKAPFVHIWRLGTDGKVDRFRQLTDTVIVQRALG